MSENPKSFSCLQTCIKAWECKVLKYQDVNPDRQVTTGVEVLNAMAAWAKGLVDHYH